MNKVITINLGGTAYQLEERGYDALRAYLETAAARLQGNPDRDEILSDVEQAIGEKFRALAKSYKTVVVTKEVTAVLAEMGPIEDASSAAGMPSAADKRGGGAGAADATQAGSKAGSTGAPGPAKRLYRITEGAMWAGVCNGLAAYVNLDPTIVRLLFVLLTIFWGSGLLVYFVLAFVVPAADSPEDKAAAYGAPFTTQEFIRRAKAGYYDAMKSLPDRVARKEWKRRFRREIRGWGASFRREMDANAFQWRHNWWRSWGAGLPPGAGFALPLFSVLHGALAIAWLSTLISLLATGTLFGVLLPAGMPAWVAVLVVLFVYGFLVLPLKAMRWAVYRGDFDRSHASWPFVCFLDGLVRLTVAVVLVWLAIRYLPEAREAIQNIPSLFREAVSNIKDWWGPR
jgi:phage shock protein PspC (stress-responsive transcriptional regulator)